MICPNCNASMPEEARFCGMCGARLASPIATTAAPMSATITHVPPPPASAPSGAPAVVTKPLPRPCAAPVPVSPLYDWLLATVPWMTVILVEILVAILEKSDAGISPKDARSVRTVIYLSFLLLSILFNWLGCKALRAAGRTTEDGCPVGVQSGDNLGFLCLGPFWTPFRVRRLNRLGGHGPWSMLTSICLPFLGRFLIQFAKEGM